MRGSIIDTTTLNSTNRNVTQAPFVETHKPVMMMKSMRNWRTRVETCWSGFSQGTNNGSILSKAGIGHIHLDNHLFLSGFVAFAFWWEDLHHVFFAVKGYGVIGGGAVLFAASGLAGSAILPLLGIASSYFLFNSLDFLGLIKVKGWTSNQEYCVLFPSSNCMIKAEHNIHIGKYLMYM